MTKSEARCPATSTLHSTVSPITGIASDCIKHYGRGPSVRKPAWTIIGRNSPPASDVQDDLVLREADLLESWRICRSRPDSPQQRRQSVLNPSFSKPRISLYFGRSMPSIGHASIPNNAALVRKLPRAMYTCRSAQPFRSALSIPLTMLPTIMSRYAPSDSTGTFRTSAIRLRNASISRFAEILLDREHDQMRAIRRLALPPRNRHQFLLHRLIGDDDEFPRLQTKRRRREHQRLFERRPVFGADLALRVELLGGIPPVELMDELFPMDGIHYCAASFSSMADFTSYVSWLLPRCPENITPDGRDARRVLDF